MESTICNKRGKDCHSSAVSRPQRIHIDENYCKGPSSPIATIPLASTNTDIVHYSFQRAPNAVSSDSLRATLRLCIIPEYVLGREAGAHGVSVLCLKPQSCRVGAGNHIN